MKRAPDLARVPLVLDMDEDRGHQSRVPSCWWGRGRMCGCGSDLRWDKVGCGPAAGRRCGSSAGAGLIWVGCFSAGGCHGKGRSHQMMEWYDGICASGGVKGKGWDVEEDEGDPGPSQWVCVCRGSGPVCDSCVSDPSVCRGRCASVCGLYHWACVRPRPRELRTGNPSSLRALSPDPRRKARCAYTPCAVRPTPHSASATDLSDLRG